MVDFADIGARRVQASNAFEKPEGEGWKRASKGAGYKWYKDIGSTRSANAAAGAASAEDLASAKEEMLRTKFTGAPEDGSEYWASEDVKRTTKSAPKSETPPATAKPKPEAPRPPPTTVNQNTIKAARREAEILAGRRAGFIGAAKKGVDFIASPAGRVVGLTIAAAAGIGILSGLQENTGDRERKRRREGLAKHGHTLSSQASMMHQFS